jgi:hypothetical protein
VSGSHRPRVLVAGDDYYASLATVRGLRKGGYEPWFATHAPNTFAARSRATAGTFPLPHPAAGDDAYVAALADAGRGCRADVVLPCNELAIKAVAGREHMLPPEAIVASSSRETVLRATDKAVLAELGAEVGVPAPATLELGRDNLDLHRHRLSFPTVAKPATTAVSERDRTWLAPPARLVESAEELEQVLGGAPRWLVQPYLRGALTAVSGVAWRGDVACSAHQRAMRIYPTPLGVSAYAETVPVDRALDDALREIVRRLDLSGIFEFQLIRSEAGSHLIDLNPRPYGSLALAIAAGLNLPAIWVDLLLGREPRIGVFRAGVHYRAEAREARALVSALSRGRLGQAASIVRPRRRTVHAIFSWRDPAPLFVAAGRLWPQQRRGGLRSEPLPVPG